MVQFQKDAALGGIPFGVLEVVYPDKPFRRTEDFRIMVEEHLRLLREKYADYDRKALFGENVYFRFFRKFKKTYPVMMQLESFLLKGRPFPIDNSVTAIPGFSRSSKRRFSPARTTWTLSAGLSACLPERKKRRFPACGVRRYIPTPATSARGTTRASFSA